MIRLNINKLLIFFGIIAGIFIIALLIWFNTDIEVTNPFQESPTELSDNKNISNITGLECSNASKRPVAVMLAGDLIDRPISGLGQADMVFEMPVAPNGITRFMAIFQCEEPAELGSVRSARNEFIPLAAGMGAILAHWGGEHAALVKLDNKILDNVDAMKYEGTVFYRKKGLRPPHDGFTSFTKIIDKSEDLKYSLENIFIGYSHENKEVINKTLSNIANEITVYRTPFDVKWVYDSEKNTYKRLRTGTPEIDKSTGNQIQASTVAVIKTTSKVINDLYISVGIPGEGTVKIYQNGIVTNGKWKKDPSQLTSKLYFYDNTGKEIPFVPGKIWVEIITD